MPEPLNEAAQLEADVTTMGRRLGLLLAVADMTDEQKEAWVALIPEMNAQQLADFTAALEKRVPDAEEQAFAKLAAKLQEAQGRYDTKVAAATDEAKGALDSLEAELTPPTQS